MTCLCTCVHGADKCDMRQSRTGGQTLAVCGSGSWRTVAGHKWHRERSDSVCDIIIAGLAQCVLHISMCRLPSADTNNNGLLVFFCFFFFSHPHEPYISQIMTHCLQFVFLFVVFSTRLRFLHFFYLFFFTTNLLIFTCIVLLGLLEGLAWVSMLIMLC